MVLAWLLLLSDGLGASYEESGVRFRLYSAHATRIEVCLFAAARGESEKARIPLTHEGSGLWSVTVPLEDVAKQGISETIYYGYRAWGPNWRHTPEWKPGSAEGFVADVDSDGNRFNPNKLLIDPYAREMSHDPLTPNHTKPEIYLSGPKHRNLDSALVAPKGIVLRSERGDLGSKPTRPFKDEIIYEVHLRGLTMLAHDVPEDCRGTYKGAALKAAYLKDLGVTAVEFIPVFESQNDANDVRASTDGDNYWGYMTLNFFSPDRRYASDKSPGGPTREFREMVKAFHDQGLKVYLDVVYNHTGEGGTSDKAGDVASLFSWRGLDNATYYQLTWDRRFYWDNTGCGGNVNAANAVVRDMILDSLQYWTREMGVDGFRFDLAPVLGNSRTKEGFLFDRDDPKNALNRARRELPGVDFIAEPWGIGEGTHQLGNHPAGWAEWNAAFRETIRKDQNKLGVERVTPGDLAMRFSGSADLFQDDGRKPWHSVNYLVSHDGFPLRDLYSYNEKRNKQPWPYGPSDGGDDHNQSWDQKGDAAMQRQAARTGLALLMLSAGVPMITGGDELWRTQYGNNNAYNLDSEKNWIPWSFLTQHASHVRFVRTLLRFRRDHPALRPTEFFTGKDRNGNGLKDITWLKDDGAEAGAEYMQDAQKHFLAFRIDGSEFDDPASSLYVAYNGWSGPVTATLPSGAKWLWVGDTGAAYEGSNLKEAGAEKPVTGAQYILAPRSVLLLLAK